MRTNTIKVAIQGDKASFHEIAALRYYKQPIDIVYCQSFGEVFLRLKNGEVDRALVAVSNSNHGIISEVEALLEENDVQTEGEYALPIEQHIIVLPQTKPEGIKKVISHPVALSQCSGYLAGRFPNAELEEYYDTSAAVALVAQELDPSMVAIGSERAAQVHNLAILHRAVQDDADNTTLFRSFLDNGN